MFKDCVVNIFSFVGYYPIVLKVFLVKVLPAIREMGQIQVLSQKVIPRLENDQHIES